MRGGGGGDRNSTRFNLAGDAREPNLLQSCIDLKRKKGPISTVQPLSTTLNINKKTVPKKDSDTLHLTARSAGLGGDNELSRKHACCGSRLILPDCVPCDKQPAVMVAV